MKSNNTKTTPEVANSTIDFAAETQKALEASPSRAKLAEAIKELSDLQRRATETEAEIEKVRQRAGDPVDANLLAAQVATLLAGGEIPIPETAVARLAVLKDAIRQKQADIAKLRSLVVKEVNDSLKPTRQTIADRINAALKELRAASDSDLEMAVVLTKERIVLRDLVVFYPVSNAADADRQWRAGAKQTGFAV